MSHAEEQAAKARLLDDYVATRKRVTLLRVELDAYLKAFKILADHMHGLVHGQYGLYKEPDWATLPEMPKFRERIEDFKAEDARLKELAARLGEMGVDVRS